MEEDCNAAPQPVENPTQIPLGESIQGQTLWCDTPTNLGTYDQSRRLHETLDFPPQPLLLPLEIQLALQNVQPPLQLVQLVMLVALPLVAPHPENSAGVNLSALDLQWPVPVPALPVQPAARPRVA